MAELPSVAVVIPAYNAAKTLRRAVESVWATGYPNLTVAIVDDGSSDGTAEVAAALCAGMPDRCTLFGHPGGGNRGVSAARNLGIERTHSEWVAFLDSDDSYLPQRFDCLRSAATGRQSRLDDTRPEAYYGLAEMCFDGKDRDDEHWWSRTGDALFGIREPLHGDALLGKLLEGVCWATSAITVTRSLLERAGGFDSAKAIAEDCDLWQRMAAVGRVVPGDLDLPVSRYHRHGANSYQYRVEHRVAMLKAMLDAARWARRNGAPPSRLAVFRDGVPQYAYRALVVAREGGRLDVARSILRLMAASRQWRFLARPRTVRQSLALLRGRAAGR